MWAGAWLSLTAALLANGAPESCAPATRGRAQESCSSGWALMQRGKTSEKLRYRVQEEAAAAASSDAAPHSAGVSTAATAGGSWYGKCMPRCYYINLDRRPDRRNRIEAQFRKADDVLKCGRFRAMDARALGTLPQVASCRSHIAALQRLEASNASYGLVLEDDVVWATADMAYVQQQICELERYLQEFPVVLLSCNTDGARLGEPTEHAGLIHVNSCQTVSAYVVRHDYMRKLIDLWRAMPETKDSWTDQAWKALQKTDGWAMMHPVLIKQGPSYSDIDMKVVDWGV